MEEKQLVDKLEEIRNENDAEKRHALIDALTEEELRETVKSFYDFVNRH